MRDNTDQASGLCRSVIKSQHRCCRRGSVIEPDDRRATEQASHEPDEPQHYHSHHFALVAALE